MRLVCEHRCLPATVRVAISAEIVALLIGDVLWSSNEGQTVDALAPGGDEGRG